MIGGASPTPTPTPTPPPRVVAWGREDLERVAELWAQDPADPVISTEDLDHLWPDPEAGGAVVVLGAGDGSGAAVVSLPAGAGAAHLQLLVVHPQQRRRGVGTALVRAAEDAAVAAGCGRMVVGAGAPFYVLTGLDARRTAALCCFEALGYRRSATELDLRCATRGHPRAEISLPAGVELAPVRSDDDAAALAAMVSASFPHWQPEFARAALAGTVTVARRGDRVLGAAAHSVTRLGVVGPVAVDPQAHGNGVGSAVVRAVLAELAVAGVAAAEIAWTSTVRFYQRCCGAEVGRCALVLEGDLAPRVSR